MTAPLLLLPLRLEYRVVTTRRRPQIWFRWYPDDGFAERGVPPIEPTERPELAAFDTAVGTRQWWDADDPVVAAAFSTLAARVGAPRAVHLLRQRDDAGTPDWAERMGLVATPPARVGLFALDAAGAITALGEGGPVPADLRMSPAALAPGGWLVDFGAAVEVGMGVRLTAPATVDLALAAPWIVAAGVHDGDAAAGIGGLLADAVAHGTFGFLAQDTPSNTSVRGRSPDVTGRTDPLGHLRACTADEAARLGSPLEQAADLAAEALGVDPLPLRRAAHADDTALEDARAMIRVVGPTLLDAVAGAVRGLDDVTDDDVVEFLARGVVARGPLPVLRIGANPYGLLPVARTGQLTPADGTTTAEQAVHAVLQRYADEYLRSEATYATRVVTRLQPAEPRLAEKLETILAQLPTSRRLLVSDIGETGAEAVPLGCPYVRGSGFEPADYLRRLATEQLSALDDPTADERRAPLLYRLARAAMVKTTGLPILEFLTDRRKLDLRGTLDLLRPDVIDQRLVALLTANVAGLAVGNGFPTGLPDRLRRLVGRRSAAMVAALQHLESVAARPDGTAALEVLLMETIDLTQHRADAWMTGIAHRHLVARRRAGTTGLSAGWFGFVQRPAPGAGTGTATGYLQAPSLAQAGTAALLRAAHERFRTEGAFAIDLDSRRVRHALALLALLARGMSPAHALALRAERWLHERGRAELTLLLRERVPMREADTGRRIDLRAFDALDLLDRPLTIVTAADRPVLRELLAAMRDELDALADLVLCEAAHLRATGQATAANAWLGVLSGDPVPGEPTFIRTTRPGQGSSHRVVVALTPEPVGDGPPRAIVEPTLAAAAARLLPETTTSVLDVVVGSGPGAERVRLALAADLGMVALDLVIGGESEVAVRARHALVTRWRRDPAIAARLGPLPEADLNTVLADRSVTLDLTVGGQQAQVRSLLDRAAQLRTLVTEGRPLEPADLAASASPDRPLDGPARRAALRPGRAALRQRVRQLAVLLDGVDGPLRAARSTLLVRIREHRRRVDVEADAAAVAASLAEVGAARERLDDVLVAASRFAEPAALRLVTTAEMIAAPEALEAELGRLGDRLDARARALTEAMVGTEVTPTTGDESAAHVRRLVEVAQATVDGDALPVLPPSGRVPETTPLLAPPIDPGTALEGWPDVRERVRRAVALADPGGWRAFPVTAEATDDESGDATADTRDEPDAPRTHLFGAVLAHPDTLAGSEPVAGIVVDEWSEVRPARHQQTGVAVHYDAPQSEPPHCLLLCEPAADLPAGWTAAEAAGFVGEAIRWMTVRALPAQQRRLPASLLPFSNQVVAKPTVPQPARRIPIRRLRRGIDLLSGFGEGKLVVFDDGEPVGLDGIGLREITGFAGED